MYQLKEDFLQMFPESNFENVVANLVADKSKKISEWEADFDNGVYHYCNSERELLSVHIGNEITPAILETVPDDSYIERVDDGGFVYKISRYTKQIPDVNELVSSILLDRIESKRRLMNRVELPEYIKSDTLSFEIPEKIFSSTGRNTAYTRDHILVRIREIFEKRYEGISYYGLLNALYSAEEKIFNERNAEFERGEYNNGNSVGYVIERDVSIGCDAKKIKRELAIYAHKNAAIKLCPLDEDGCEGEMVPRIVFTEYKKMIECPVFMTAIRIINLCTKEITRIDELLKLENRVAKLSII